MTEHQKRIDRNIKRTYDESRRKRLYAAKVLYDMFYRETNGDFNASLKYASVISCIRYEDLKDFVRDENVY